MNRKVLGHKISLFLHTLPAEKRNIFLRRYWYMDGIKDIPVAFGMSESKVKITLHRCRNKLRDYLDEGYVI